MTKDLYSIFTVIKKFTVYQTADKDITKGKYKDLIIHNASFLIAISFI